MKQGQKGKGKLKIFQLVLQKVSEYVLTFMNKGLLSHESIQQVCTRFICQTEEQEKDEAILCTESQLAILWTKSILSVATTRLEQFRQEKKAGFYDAVSGDRKVLTKVIEFLIAGAENKEEGSVNLMIQLLHNAPAARTVLLL